MKLKNTKAFTLLEVMIVLVIIGVVVTFGIPRYTTMIERTLDKIAIGNLKLIGADIKIYQMELGCGDINCVDTDCFNATLGGLSLPTGNSANWNYVGGDHLDCGYDVRVHRWNYPSGWYRNWQLTDEMEEPCCVPRNQLCPSDKWCPPVCP